MRKLWILFALLLTATPALAANCSPYPYTLQNGQTADANQVMSNFNSILTCSNSSLLGVNNNLSDVQNGLVALGNLGAHNGAITGITVSNSPPSGSANSGDLWIQW